MSPVCILYICHYCHYVIIGKCYDARGRLDRILNFEAEGGALASASDAPSVDDMRY